MIIRVHTKRAFTLCQSTRRLDGRNQHKHSDAFSVFEAGLWVACGLEAHDTTSRIHALWRSREKTQLERSGREGERKSFFSLFQWCYRRSREHDRLPVYTRAPNALCGPRLFRIWQTNLVPLCSTRLFGGVGLRRRKVQPSVTTTSAPTVSPSVLKTLSVTARWHAVQLDGRPSLNRQASFNWDCFLASGCHWARQRNELTWFASTKDCGI